MEISAILSTAFRRFWQEKVFWLLGALAAAMPALTLPVSQLANAEDLQTLFPAQFSGVETWLLSLLSIIVLLGLSLISIPLYLVGILGVTVGVWQREQGNESPLSFGELLRAGLPFFWRALGARIIFALGLMVIFIPLLVMIGIASILTFGLALLCLLPLVFLSIPLSYGIYALIELAETAIVVENLPISAAISKAWALFKAHFWKIVLMALIIYLGIGLLGSIVVLPLILPAYLPMLGEFNMQANPGVLLGISLGLLCVLSPLYALVQGAMITLQKVTWVQTYLALTRPAAPAEMVEVLDVG